MAGLLQQLWHSNDAIYQRQAWFFRQTPHTAPLLVRGVHQDALAAAQGLQPVSEQLARSEYIWRHSLSKPFSCLELLNNLCQVDVRIVFQALAASSCTRSESVKCLRQCVTRRLGARSAMCSSQVSH